MAREIEIKIQIQGGLEELFAIFDKLSSLGAKWTGREKLKDTYYEGTLLGQSESLRIREVWRTGDVERGFAWRNPQLCFKRKFDENSNQSGIKDRTELECSIYEREDIVPILEALGFVETVVVNKQRRTCEIDGCNVMLDDLYKGFGQFVEIEGPSDEAVKTLMEKLDIEGDVVLESYQDIVKAS